MGRSILALEKVQIYHIVLAFQMPAPNGSSGLTVPTLETISSWGTCEPPRVDGNAEGSRAN